MTVQTLCKYNVMTSPRVKNLVKAFSRKFGHEPVVINSPGRINLLGEHTDYNDGFVLPAAVDKSLMIAIASNGLKECRVYSEDFDEEAVFSIENIVKSEKEWANYILGVLDQLQKLDAHVGGFDCMFGGDIPIGAGMSSSAALECGIGAGLNEVFDLGLEKIDIVKIGRAAENEFVGVKCGIMDQFANMFGSTNHVIKLDCRSLDYDYYEADFTSYKFLLFDSNVKHSLADSEYNIRRQECSKAVELLKRSHPEVISLRDCDLDMIDFLKNYDNPKLYKRANYVVRENDRVKKAGEVLSNNQLEEFGKLMYETHEGLSNDYEVSCEELDILVRLSKDYQNILGARMMGGGFGGCTLNLVKDEQIDQMVEEMSKRYQKETGKKTKVYKVKISTGTSKLY